MKIYNEVVIDMNPESSSYGKTLYEDSFEHKGPLVMECGYAFEEGSHWWDVHGNHWRDRRKKKFGGGWGGYSIYKNDVWQYDDFGGFSDATAVDNSVKNYIVANTSGVDAHSDLYTSLREMWVKEELPGAGEGEGVWDPNYNLSFTNMLGDFRPTPIGWEDGQFNPDADAFKKLVERGLADHGDAYHYLRIGDQMFGQDARDIEDFDIKGFEEIGSQYKQRGPGPDGIMGTYTGDPYGKDDVMPGFEVREKEKDWWKAKDDYSIGATALGMTAGTSVWDAKTIMDKNISQTTSAGSGWLESQKARSKRSIMSQYMAGSRQLESDKEAARQQYFDIDLPELTTAESGAYDDFWREQQNQYTMAVTS